jgi:hypothetical protein
LCQCLQTLGDIVESLVDSCKNISLVIVDKNKI